MLWQGNNRGYENSAYYILGHIQRIKKYGELITRESYPTPIFHINKDIKDFYDFTVDDVWLENYVTGPQIKNIPVAV